MPKPPKENIRKVVSSVHRNLAQEKASATDQKPLMENIGDCRVHGDRCARWDCQYRDHTHPCQDCQTPLPCKAARPQDCWPAMCDPCKKKLVGAKTYAPEAAERPDHTHECRDCHGDIPCNATHPKNCEEPICGPCLQKWNDKELNFPAGQIKKNEAVDEPDQERALGTHGTQDGRPYIWDPNQKKHVWDEPSTPGIHQTRSAYDHTYNPRGRGPAMAYQRSHGNDPRGPGADFKEAEERKPKDWINDRFGKVCMWPDCDRPKKPHDDYCGAPHGQDWYDNHETRATAQRWFQKGEAVTAPKNQHQWNDEFCSCGQDSVTCQKCGKRVCGEIAHRTNNGNFCPGCGYASKLPKSEARVFMNFSARPGGYNGKPAWDAQGSTKKYSVFQDGDTKFQALFSDEQWASHPIGYFSTMHDAMAACENMEGEKLESAHRCTQVPFELPDTPGKSVGVECCNCSFSTADEAGRHEAKYKCPGCYKHQDKCECPKLYKNHPANEV